MNSNDKKQKVDMLQKYIAGKFLIDEKTIFGKQLAKTDLSVKAISIYLLSFYLDFTEEDFLDVSLSLDSQTVTRGFESGRKELKIAESLLSLKDYIIKIKDKDMSGN